MNWRKVLFVFSGLLALYGSTTTLFIFLNMWQRGTFLAYEPNLVIRTLETSWAVYGVLWITCILLTRVFHRK